MANMAQAFSGILNIATASSSTVVGSVNFVHKGVSGLNIIAEQWLEDLQESEVINKDHRRQKLVTQNAKAEADLLEEVDQLCRNPSYSEKFKSAFKRKMDFLEEYDKKKAEKSA